MTDDSRKANIQAEVEKASSSLKAAQVLFTAGLYDECVSRAYYAVFHMACGLLLTEGLEARRHRGVDHLLNLQFVRAGRLDPRHAKAFARLAQYRMQADYSRAFRFTAEGAEEELRLAEATVEALRIELEKGGWLQSA